MGRKFSLRWVLVLLCGVGIFLAVRQGIYGAPESIMVRFSTPIVRVARGVGETVTQSVNSFLRVRRLSRAVRLLEEENARLQASVARLESLEQENTVLREQLKLLPRAQRRMISADVASRTTDGVSDGLVINRGSQDGIEAGQPVIVSDGVLVGRVHAVQPGSAIIALLTDPSVRLGGIVRRSGAEGLVHGVRGIDLSFDTVPRTDSLVVDDRVVTSGTDGAFPPDLLVGTIQSIEAPENEIFQSAHLTLSINPRTVRVVSILLP